MDREAFNFTRGIRANSNSWAHIRTTSNRFTINFSKPQIKSNQLLWDCGLRDNDDTWTQRRDCLDISDSVWDGGEHEEGAVAPPPLRRGDKEAQRESLSHSTKAPFLCILVRLLLRDRENRLSLKIYSFCIFHFPFSSSPSGLSYQRRRLINSIRRVCLILPNVPHRGWIRFVRYILLLALHFWVGVWTGPNSYRTVNI